MYKLGRQISPKYHDLMPRVFQLVSVSTLLYSCVNCYIKLSLVRGDFVSTR